MFEGNQDSVDCIFTSMQFCYPIKRVILGSSRYCPAILRKNRFKHFQNEHEHARDKLGVIIQARGKKKFTTINNLMASYQQNQKEKESYC